MKGMKTEEQFVVSPQRQQSPDSRRRYRRRRTAHWVTSIIAVAVVSPSFSHAEPIPADQQRERSHHHQQQQSQTPIHPASSSLASSSSSATIMDVDVNADANVDADFDRHRNMQQQQQQDDNPFSFNFNNATSSCSLTHPFQEDRHKRIYTIGVLAIRGEDAAFREFNSTFNEYLTATTGKAFDPPVQFQMKAVHFFSLDVKPLDFVYVNPSVYSCIASEFTAQSLASQISRRTVAGVTYNLTEFGGVIVARSDREDISTIQDLRNQIVAAVSLSGLGSGQMQFLEMLNNGMSYTNDPKQLVFTSNQVKIVHGVLNRTFDVGFVKTDQLERTLDWNGNPVDLADFKIINLQPPTDFPFATSTALYPEWNLAALRHVDPQVSRQVQKAMLALSDHAKVAAFQQYEGQIRCDTTPEIAQLALRAMADGNYAGWQTTLSYMRLRSMQESLQYVRRNSTTNTWACVQPSNMYDAIVCPANYRIKSNVETTCADMGLECAEGYQCLCSPCEEITTCDNGMRMWNENCVSYAVLLPSLLVPTFVLMLLLCLWYIAHKKWQADSVFHVNPEELVFLDPPVIVGQGTFGQVLLAEYRGTRVAVKRVIPPSNESHFAKREMFDIRASSSNLGHVMNNHNIDGSSNSHHDDTNNNSGSLNAGSLILAPNDVERQNHGSAAFDDSTNLGLQSLGPNILRKTRGKRITTSLEEIRSSNNSANVRTNYRTYNRLKADFILEMKHLSKLRHPCITTVMGAVLSRYEEPMLVMEYMAYGSLFDVIHNPDLHLDYGRTFMILQNIIQGLRFLHSANPQVIHGDLKSQNCLVDDSFRAKVTDFGLSAKKTLNAVGTPYWMAPELLRGESSNTAASDIYSFGIVMFELFSHQVPYHGEDHESVLKDVCNPKRNKRPKLPGHCSERIKRMYSECVDPDPEKRPTAEQLDLLLSVEQKVSEETDTLEATNKQLSEANRKIAAAAALQLQHFACMSHEIRTPLNCIIGLSSLMEESELTLHQRESMQMIISSGNLLRCIVDDVLDYSKLESGNVVIDVRRINLQVLLSGVIQSIRISPIAEAKHLNIRCEYSSSLTEHIEMDTRRLQQILYNLLSNAIKFSRPEGLVVMNVSILKDPKSSTVVHPESHRIIRFTVVDHGKGIERADFQKIFEPFKQTTTGIDNLHGGTGLGLAITKRLVEALGGTISVDSKVGEWAKFTVDFPFPGQTAALDKAAARLSNAKLFLISEGSDDDTNRALGIFRLFSLKVVQHKDMDALVANLDVRSLKVDASIIVLMQEGLYNDELLQILSKAVKVSLVTFGPKFQVKNAKFHYHSLMDVFPIVLLETLGSCVPSSNPTGSARRWSQINPNSVSQVTKVPLENLRIMIADDNVVNQKVLKRIVNRLGITQVKVVANGKESVDLEAEETFDIVLMDMQMPVMDGLEACKLINSRVGGHPRAKVVFVTAHVSDDFRTTCLQNGATGYLPKPCTIDTVKKVIQEAAPVVEENHLPVLDENFEASELVTGQEAAPSRMLASFADMRVLIADDIVVNQKVLKRIVNRIGITEVKVVDNGRNAAELEAAEPFDVVLMDLQMPIMDGLESCKLIVSRTQSVSEGNRHPPAKVIFVTAHVSEEFKTTCMANGAVGYLPKPCSVDSVKAMLQSVFPVS